MDNMWDYLRPATAEEYVSVRDTRYGVFASLTDMDGEFGEPKMMTCWASEHGAPLCLCETRDFPAGGSYTEGTNHYWINSDYARRGV